MLTREGEAQLPKDDGDGGVAAVERRGKKNIQACLAEATENFKLEQREGLTLGRSWG